MYRACPPWRFIMFLVIGLVILAIVAIGFALANRRGDESYVEPEFTLGDVTEHMIKLNIKESDAMRKDIAETAAVIRKARKRVIGKPYTSADDMVVTWKGTNLINFNVDMSGYVRR